MSIVVLLWVEMNDCNVATADILAGSWRRCRVFVLPCVRRLRPAARHTQHTRQPLGEVKKIAACAPQLASSQPLLHNVYGGSVHNNELTQSSPLLPARQELLIITPADQWGLQKLRHSSTFR